MIQEPLQPLGHELTPPDLDEPARTIYQSLRRVERWVEDHRYKAYEPFDGLSSPLRRLTRGSLLLERLLQQAVRQSPVNLRPLVGIKPLPSTKGRGYMAAGYLNLYRLTGDPRARTKAIDCFEWLIEHRSPRYQEFSWANHYDFASRAGRYPKHESIIVWSSLIGQAFLDGFELLGDHRYLEVAESVCRWILALPRERTDSGTCISYHMLSQLSIHNANLLGAAMLARTWRHSRRPEYLELAALAVLYSCSRQRPDGSWWYAEGAGYHWIDSFHTGYCLDSLKCYLESTGDGRFQPRLDLALQYFTARFVEPDGRPRYYHNRAHPTDIQAASQTIETLARFSRYHNSLLPIAIKVARWTIEHLQNQSGYFYYRKYPLLTVKTPMLHWGQATMYHALSLLLLELQSSGERQP